MLSNKTACLQGRQAGNKCDLKPLNSNICVCVFAVWGFWCHIVYKMPVVFLEIYHLLLWPLRSWLACVRNKERDRESRTHLKYNPKNVILFCYGLKINKRYTSLLYAKSHSNFMCVSGRMQNYGNGRIYTKSHLKCAQTHQMCVWVWLCLAVHLRLQSMAIVYSIRWRCRWKTQSICDTVHFLWHVGRILLVRSFVCFYSRAKYKCAINVPMEFPHYRGVVVASCQKMQMPSV